MSAWVRFVHTVSSNFRRRRSQIFREQFPNLADLRVCDLGGSRHFWEMMPDDLRPRDLLLLNIADDGQSRSHTGAMDDLKIEFYDGQTIPYPDGHFDVLLCNSVIEHVPPALRQRLSQEISRAAKYYFVQTPALVVPIEPHFVFPCMHWLPRTWGRKLAPFGVWALMEKPSSAKIDSYFNEVHLLGLKEVRTLFPKASIRKERALGWVKSYIAHGEGIRAAKQPTTARMRNAAAG